MMLCMCAMSPSRFFLLFLPEGRQVKMDLHMLGRCITLLN